MPLMTRQTRRRLRARLRPCGPALLENASPGVGYYVEIFSRHPKKCRFLITSAISGGTMFSHVSS